MSKLKRKLRWTIERKKINQINAEFPHDFASWIPILWWPEKPRLILLACQTEKRSPWGQKFLRSKIKFFMSQLKKKKDIRRVWTSTWCCYLNVILPMKFPLATLLLQHTQLVLLNGPKWYLKVSWTHLILQKVIIYCLFL